MIAGNGTAAVVRAGVAAGAEAGAVIGTEKGAATVIEIGTATGTVIAIDTAIGIVTGIGTITVAVPRHTIIVVVALRPSIMVISSVAVAAATATADPRDLMAGRSVRTTKSVTGWRIVGLDARIARQCGMRSQLPTRPPWTPGRLT